MPGGRPSKYTKEVGDKLCALITMGKSLNSILGDEEKDSDFPTRATVYAWFSKHEEFIDNYTRAKEQSAYADDDKIAEVAESVLSGVVKPDAARVAIDALKWMAGKKKPKKYGDKIQTEHSGNVGYTDMSDEGLAKRLEEIRAEKAKLDKK